MSWIGIDLDATLAEWGPGTSNPGDVMRIGAPIPKMIDRVKAFLAEGQEVRIFTARVGPASDDEAKAAWRDCDTIEEFIAYQRQLIEAWCLYHLGVAPVVTCVKDFHMYLLYDDRAIQMVPNTGQTLEEITGVATSGPVTP